MVSDKDFGEIIKAYNMLVKGIDEKADKDTTGRAYGGIVRAGKGKMLERIAKELVKLAWADLKQKSERLNIIGRRINIPIEKKYLDRIKDKEVKEHIQANLKDYFYPYKSDVLIAIDGKIVFEVECKAYAENAMFKRILVDCMLLKRMHSKLKFALLQLESQLGGDYSELKANPLGSPSTHTLLSMFDINVRIITLLKGERKVDEPIHKKEFFKPLTKESLLNAIDEFKEALSEFA